MAASAAINPKTGKRYNFVAPERRVREEDAQLATIEREIALLERQQKAMKARDSLLDFTEFTMPHPEAPNDVKRSAYRAARFHKQKALALEAVERGEIPMLILCEPPRHGKSEIATRRMAAWYSGRHPEHDVAVGSYSDTMAQDFGADTRAILTSSQFKQVFPAYKLRRGGNAKDNIQTVAGGRLVYVGRGGALTGRGAHLLLLDDLFKDHEEARSQAIRDQAWNWFTKVAMTRRMGKRLVVITMTRWHSDDIIGRLTDPENPHYNEIEAKKYKIIRLPAIAEEDDPLGRKEGEALWPEEYGLDYLESMQRLDPLGFASLYQQRPTVADGVLFRRETIQYYTPNELPDELRFYCASDHAVGTNQRNDYTCMLKVGVDRQSNIYLIDCFWKKVRSDVAVEAMLAMASGNMRPLIWWAEKGHISKAIGPFLHTRMRETGIYINIREMTPVADKEQRAQSMAARQNMGKVYFPRHASWTERAIDELMSFPNGTFNDFGDTYAWIGVGLQSQFGPSGPPKGSKKAPTFGTLGWVKYQERFDAEKRERAARGGF